MNVNVSGKGIALAFGYILFVGFGLGVLVGQELGGREWKETAKTFGQIGLELGEALNRKNGSCTESGDIEENS